MVTFALADGEIFQRYLRNAEHSMALHAASNQHIFEALYEVVLYSNLKQEHPTPKVTFSRETSPEPNRQGIYVGKIRMESDTEPEAVNFYFARTQSKKRRDWRLVYIGCGVKQNDSLPWNANTNHHDWESDECECPDVIEEAESAGTNTKGICPQFLLWTDSFENPVLANKFGVKLKKVEGEKYEYAWEGILEAEEDSRLLKIHMNKKTF